MKYVKEQMSEKRAFEESITTFGFLSYSYSSICSGEFQIYSDASKKGLVCTHAHGKLIAICSLQQKPYEPNVLADALDRKIKLIAASRLKKRLFVTFEHWISELCVRDKMVSGLDLSRPRFRVDDDGILWRYKISVQRSYTSRSLDDRWLIDLHFDSSRFDEDVSRSQATLLVEWYEARCGYVGERILEGPEMIEVTNEKVAVAREKLKEAQTRQKSYADRSSQSVRVPAG
ncbi:hypothetical protein Tco_0343354 [Tanacetum coccineum]